MNEHYLASSNNTYKIDGLFKPNDVVIPTDHPDQQCSGLLLNKLQTPMPRVLTEQDEETNHTQASESDGRKVFVTKRDSAGKGSDSTYSGTPESQTPECDDHKFLKVNLKTGQSSPRQPQSYTEIMMSRWQKTQDDLPGQDLDDCLLMVKPSTKTRDLRQAEPEYAQTSYLRMRSTEEAYCIYNYFDPVKNKALQSVDKKRGFKHIQVNDRSFAMQLMLQLYKKRGYSHETLFTGAAVLDRYLALTGPQNFASNQTTNLALACLLIGAKLEQPKHPNFMNMINALEDLNGDKCKKEDLVELEEKILRLLGFDFNFNGPKQFLDRYLRVLGYDNNAKVNQMALQILTLSLVDEKLLNYRASQIAASAVVLAINIYMVQKELKEGIADTCATSFFNHDNGASNGAAAQSSVLRKRSDKRILNTNIWNNVNVSTQTGYTMEMLKPCLYDLSKFIEEYLEPNKLKYFDIEAINTLQDCLADSRSGSTDKPNKPVNIELIQ